MRSSFFPYLDSLCMGGSSPPFFLSFPPLSRTSEFRCLPRFEASLFFRLENRGLLFFPCLFTAKRFRCSLFSFLLEPETGGIVPPLVFGRYYVLVFLFLFSPPFFSRRNRAFEIPFCSKRLGFPLSSGSPFSSLFPLSPFLVREA